MTTTATIMSLREGTSTALQALFTPPNSISLPITSEALLPLIVGLSVQNLNLPSDSYLRLTDLAKLDNLLETFATSWDCGAVTIKRTTTDQGGPSSLSVERVVITRSIQRKRKRGGESRFIPSSSSCRRLHLLTPNSERPGATARSKSSHNGSSSH